MVTGASLYDESGSTSALLGTCTGLSHMSLHILGEGRRIKTYELECSADAASCQVAILISVQREIIGL